MKHQDWLAGQLKDHDFAASYLTQAAQDLKLRFLQRRCGMSLMRAQG